MLYYASAVGSFSPSLSLVGGLVNMYMYMYIYVYICICLHGLSMIMLGFGISSASDVQLSRVLHGICFLAFSFTGGDHISSISWGVTEDEMRGLSFGFAT